MPVREGCCRDDCGTDAPQGGLADRYRVLAQCPRVHTCDESRRCWSECCHRAAHRPMSCPGPRLPCTSSPHWARTGWIARHSPPAHGYYHHLHTRLRHIAATLCIHPRPIHAPICTLARRASSRLGACTWLRSTRFFGGSTVPGSCSKTHEAHAQRPVENGHAGHSCMRQAGCWATSGRSSSRVRSTISLVSCEGRRRDEPPHDGHRM